jgi:ABC transporter ATM
LDPAESKVSTDKEQRLTDWSIVKRLAVNIWPKGEIEVKTRVVGALVLLVAGKVSLGKWKTMTPRVPE